MNSEVSITLSGENIPVFKPIGATINYGINRIPTAAIRLDPSANPMLCDFDSIRRSRATLEVHTTKDCLYFDGVIDGLSFSQASGGLSASLILKHPFQWLTEVYPRIIGVHPSSNNVFRPLSLLNIGNLLDSDQAIRALQLYGINLRFDQNLIDFTIDLMIAAIRSQYETNFVGTTNLLNQALQDSAISRNALTGLALELLTSIDTTATKRMRVSAASEQIADLSLNRICSLEDTLYSNLIRLLSEVGCCLVIGNKHAYVVPEAAYLQISKPGNVATGQKGSAPNVIYPSEYDNLVFNDNGYVNIRGVYVEYDNGTHIAGTPNLKPIDLGIFVDDSTFGNIYVTSLPMFVSFGIVQSAAVTGAAMQNTIRRQLPLCTGQNTFEQHQAAVTEQYDTILSDDERQTFMNEWAQMIYCKMKYDDRVGSISAIFNNNWAPGMVGTLYTRTPGTFLDFYVTDVTHSFDLSPPNNGQATTSITFKGGRMGTTSSLGLDTIDFYQYGYRDALDFGYKFLKDISE